MSPNDLPAYMAHVGAAARAAATAMAAASTAAKDDALRRLAALLREHMAALQAANAPDVAAAERAGLAPALVDRLRLTPARRLEAWIVTGPLGHLAGGLADWGGLLARWASARVRGRDPWA